MSQAGSPPENLSRFFVNGAWVTPHSDQHFAVMNPATDRQIGEIVLGNAKDVEAAVAAAKIAFDSYSQTTKAERRALLDAMMHATRARMEDMAQAMSQEMGAPITFARAAQADAAIGHLEAFIATFDAQEERQTLPNGDIRLREPIGVCGLITPWNWPINQIALKVIPALATGCTCVLKPSEHTPLSAMIYAEIIEAAGFPPGVFNMIHGDGPTVGAALSRHPDIQMMSLTGSLRAGIAVAKDAADTVKRVTLELGSKSPNLVFDDCDLEAQVTESVWACMRNSGQSCDAPTRLLVQQSCYERVLTIARTACNAIAVGDPAQEGDHIGPLFDRIQYERVQAMIQTGLNEGATLLAGGLGRPEGHESGWYARPTIFADVRNDMTIAREEIFGPVLVIIPFRDEREAIEIANDTPFGLAAYVQTGDQERAMRVAALLRAGAVHINGGPLRYGSPFGGYGQSGNGREGGLQGLEEFQETKTLHFPD